MLPSLLHGERSGVSRWFSIRVAEMRFSIFTPLYVLRVIAFYVSGIFFAAVKSHGS